MFLAPAVTPWFSTLPGVGSNNPGVRLYSYSRQTGCVLDYTQYFLNLTAANAAARDNWTVEYRATDAYGVPTVNAASMDAVVRRFCDARSSALFNRYFHYNSVSHDLSTCSGQCKRQQVCAALEVDLVRYWQCLESAGWLDHTTPSWSSSTTSKLLLGILIPVIAVVFVVLAVCCYQRRYNVVYFSRSHYAHIQGRP